MSVKTYTDSTTRIITKTIEEHVWEIHCDAIGCNDSLEFRENRDTGDITADGDYTGDMDNEWLNIHDTNTAIQTALQHGWQEGNKGIQRSHLYCPQAQRKPIKHQQPKKETTPALAGIGKGEPMTALLVGRLRELATQTHLLETEVSSLGWMAANGSQTLKSMTRAQAHLMLAECDLLDALEANEKKEMRGRR